MNRSDLFELIKKRKSYLCVGLDSDITRIPAHLMSEADPVFEFNKRIIDATRDLCVAYKPNLAFYEVNGSKGWRSLEKTLDYIGDSHFTIADAKRGDIGNTSTQYAKAFFENLSFDSVTIAPYMGEDSVKPFTAFADKWVILLALTSNKGSGDFQLIEDKNDIPLFEQVMKRAQKWAGLDEMMFVVGATHPEFFRKIRAIAPDHFLLVPGVGAQGGDLAAISDNGMNDHCGLLVNSSRGIIFADNGPDFDQEARNAAKILQHQMEEILIEKFKI